MDIGVKGAACSIHWKSIPSSGFVKLGNRSIAKSVCFPLLWGFWVSLDFPLRKWLHASLSGASNFYSSYDLQCYRSSTMTFQLIANIKDSSSKLRGWRVQICALLSHPTSLTHTSEYSLLHLTHPPEHLSFCSFFLNNYSALWAQFILLIIPNYWSVAILWTQHLFLIVGTNILGHRQWIKWEHFHFQLYKVSMQPSLPECW